MAQPRSRETRQRVCSSVASCHGDQRREQRESQLAPVPAAARQTAPAEPQPDHTIDVEGSDVVAALARLSLTDRRIIVLCVLEGYSIREAGTALNIPEGTVKSRLSRAKQRLKARVFATTITDLTREVGNA